MHSLFGQLTPNDRILIFDALRHVLCLLLGFAILIAYCRRFDAVVAKVESLANRSHRVQYCVAWPFIAASIIPAVFMLYTIHRLSVNAMILDDFAAMPMIVQAKSGHFRISDYWLPHNEHRMLFPYLIFYGLTKVWHFNDVTLQYIGYGFMLASVPFLWAIYRRVAGANAAPFCFFLASLLTWTPTQHFNWLRGFQIQWAMTFFAFTVAGYSLACRAGTWAGVATVCAAGVFASYSLASGLVLWPSAIFAMVVARVWSRRQVASTVAIGVVCCVVFFIRWAPSPGPPPVFSDVPIYTLYVPYFFTLLGIPLDADQSVPPAWFGAAGLLLLVAGLVSASRILRANGTPIWPRLAPPLYLCAVAIASAIVTTHGRLPYGFDTSWSSRYITIHMLFWLGILGIAGIVVEGLVARGMSRMLVIHWSVFGLGAIVFACLAFSQYEIGMKGMVAESGGQADALVTTYTYQYKTDTQLQSLDTSPLLRSRLILLDSIGEGPFLDRAREKSTLRAFLAARGSAR